MLVLTRKQGETVQIGEDVTITILEAHRGRIRIGIAAPSTTRVLRGELRNWEPTNRTGRTGRRAVALAG